MHPLSWRGTNGKDPIFLIKKFILFFGTQLCNTYCTSAGSGGSPGDAGESHNW